MLEISEQESKDYKAKQDFIKECQFMNIFHLNTILGLIIFVIISKSDLLKN